jgi:hypothetical protein
VGNQVRVEDSCTILVQWRAVAGGGPRCRRAAAIVLNLFCWPRSAKWVGAAFDYNLTSMSSCS